MSLIFDEIKNFDNINTSVNDNFIQHKKTFTSNMKGNSFNKFFESKFYLSNKITNYNNKNANLLKKRSI